MRLYVSRSEGPFVVLDALRTGVAKVLPFVRSSRFAWYVFTLGDRYFVFPGRELRETLLDSRRSRSLVDALKLETTPPSRTVASRTEWINLAELPARGTPGSRAVFVTTTKEKEAVVAAIGLIQKSQPIAKITPTIRIGDRKGIVTRRPGGATRKTPAKKASGRVFAKKAAAIGDRWRLPDRVRIAFGFADGSGASGGKSEPPAKSSSKPFEIVDVFYATDRESEKRPGVGDQVRYLNKLAKAASLSYGVCRVTIPANHKIGKLETPSIWRLQIHDDPAKHFTVLECATRTVGAFFKEVRSIVDRTENKSAFVFTHGYNVAFDDAAKRTAQLARDMKFPGAPILYSWASAASITGYSQDEETVGLTAKRLQAFLRDLSQSSGATELHLIAHSMGNRALVQALSLLQAVPVPTPKPFKQVVLTAPDVPTQDVESLIAAANVQAERVTLYASSKDKALRASKGLHAYPRLGYVYDFPLFIAGMDSIDAVRISLIAFPTCVQGGVRKRSIITNAKHHVGKPVLSTMDISKCFPSITVEKVRRVFEELGFSGDAL
jgi:esterase/lipase superfamily enzyme